MAKAHTLKNPADTEPEDSSPAVDLDALTVVLEFRGEKFEVPKRRGRWPLEAILQFGKGQGLQGIRALFTAQDWERLKGVCPTGDDFDTFIAGAIDTLTSECIL